MKRPRIALCLLMALFATSLYAVGFAADCENFGAASAVDGRFSDEAGWCEYTYQGYCEYAYDRPSASYSYDACTGYDDSDCILDDESREAAAGSQPDLDEEETGLSSDEAAAIEESVSDYEADLALEEAAAQQQWLVEAGEYEAGYAEDLAEQAEPQPAYDGAWSGRYCLLPEAQTPVQFSLPTGAISRFLDRMSDSLALLLSDPRHSAGLETAWRINAENDGLSNPVSSATPIRLNLAAIELAGDPAFVAANGALAAGMGPAVKIDPMPLPASDLRLLVGEPEPVTLRALVRPLARLAVGLRDRWQQAWSEIDAAAAEGDAVPEISSRPQAPQAVDPAGDPGRDTRTSLRRNPRRVEI